jgi:hypothetical protein
MGLPGSEGHSGPVCPTCVQNGMSELDAFRVQRIVAAIIGRQIPEPRYDAKRAQAELAHATTELSNGGHRTMKIDRADSHETMRIAPDPGRNVVIADQRAARSPPRTEKADAHAGLVHRLDRPLERNVLGGQHPMRPATEGLEYWLREKRSRGMLHPGIDDAAHRPIVARGAVDASGMRYPGAQGEISRSVLSVKSRITSSPKASPVCGRCPR